MALDMLEALTDWCFEIQTVSVLPSGAPCHFLRLIEVPYSF